MSRCRKLEKALESGCFDDRILNISDRMQDHLTDCPTCKQIYDDLLQIENLLLDAEPVELSQRAKARIRINVTDTIRAIKPKSLHWFNPVVGIALAAMIAFFIILSPFDRQSAPQQISQNIVVNDDTFADIIDLMNIDILLYNEADLETAVIMQSDNGLISDVLETLSVSTPYLNEETVYTALSDLNEKEWNLLRRYLM